MTETDSQCCALEILIYPVLNRCWTLVVTQYTCCIYTRLLASLNQAQCILDTFIIKLYDRATVGLLEAIESYFQ